MAYAIVETSGTQLRVEPGRFYDVNRIAAEDGDEVVLDRVLFIHTDDDVMVGQPTVAEATVVGKVMNHLRGPKIIVYKMKPKKKTRKKRGHRQELTRVMIEAIRVGDTSLTAAEAAPATEVPATEVAAE